MRAFCVCLLVAAVSVAEGDVQRDYSKAIVGCWLGPRKIEVYHTDGTWGVKRNEDAPEDVRGRRWQVEGNRLILTYPGDHGLETAELTIVSLTKHRLILDAGGYKKELTRYSSDCQKN